MDNYFTELTGRGSGRLLWLPKRLTAPLFRHFARQSGIAIRTLSLTLAGDSQVGYRWQSGKQGMNMATLAKLFYLGLLLQEHPGYWTGERLREEFDWRSITSHPYGLLLEPVDKQVRIRPGKSRARPETAAERAARLFQEAR